MKKSLLLSLFVLSCFWAFSQGQTIAVGLSSSHDFYFQSILTNRNMYGLQIQYFVGEKISLNNRLLFGVNKTNQELMLHYGLGGLLAQLSVQNGVIFWSGNLLQDLGGLILLPIIIPEGVQFHLGDKRRQFAPYIYPASFEYNALDEREFKALLEIGMQFKFIEKDKFFIAPSIAWKIRYGDARQAFSIGFMVGILTD